MDSVPKRESVTHEIENPGGSLGMEARRTVSTSPAVWINIPFPPSLSSASVLFTYRPSGILQWGESSPSSSLHVGKLLFLDSSIRSPRLEYYWSNLVKMPTSNHCRQVGGLLELSRLWSCPFQDQGRQWEAPRARCGLRVEEVLCLLPECRCFWKEDERVLVRQK